MTSPRRTARPCVPQFKMTIFGGADKFLQANGPCLIPLKYSPPGPEGLVNPALTLTYTNMLFLRLDRVLNSI